MSMLPDGPVGESTTTCSRFGVFQFSWHCEVFARLDLSVEISERKVFKEG